MDALRRWSEDEFRSMNSQIEMVLHRALQEAGRAPKKEFEREIKKEIEKLEAPQLSEDSPATG
jgi:hypothetical protein